MVSREWWAAKQQELDKSWEAAARSPFKEVRDLAASYKARQARAGKTQRATRMERLSQETIDMLIARSKEPRRELSVDHERIDRMTFLTPELREDMRARKVMFVNHLQALQDFEAEVIKEYRAHGYAEVEVDVDEDEDDPDDKGLKLYRALISNNFFQ